MRWARYVARVGEKWNVFRSLAREICKATSWKIDRYERRMLTHSLTRTTVSHTWARTIAGSPKYKPICFIFVHDFHLHKTFTTNLVCRCFWRKELLLQSKSLKSFSPKHCVYTGSGVHPASYPVGTGVLTSGEKQSGREANHSPPSSAMVENAWSDTSTPFSAALNQELWKTLLHIYVRLSKIAFGPLGLICNLFPQHWIYSNGYHGLRWIELDLHGVTANFVS
jgi:hypothetical protein